MAVLREKSVRNGATSTIKVKPLETSRVLKAKVYAALKQAITTMDIYGAGDPPKLDERRLAESLGVSRTPVREAISRLEQEGIVATVPHRGAFVVRKTKTEILDMIFVWAALEGMAARMATQRASSAEMGVLRKMFVTFKGADGAEARIDEYSDMNIRFHQALIGLSKCKLLVDMADNLFIHMRSIRARTITERHRAARSIIDHMHIIEALEQRDTELAERLVREHTLNLAEHVEKYFDYVG